MMVRFSGGAITKRNAGRGQSMVEFALILPILILILVGVFDLGRAFFALITINNAAREGARYGTLHRNYGVDMIKDAAIAEASTSGIVLTRSNVTITCPDDASAWPCDSGATVRVTVNYTFTSLLNMFIPASFDINRFVEMNVQ